VNHPPFTAPGLHIYGWTLGFDLTPADGSRKFGHTDVAELIVSRLPPNARLIDALWCGDSERAHRELGRHPTALKEIEPHEHSLMAAAAWWYRPDSVRLMLQYGFDPHATGAHNSTPLDRASFHGYVDIVATLLSQDSNPPLAHQNELGGIPLDACIYGSLNGWKTGHPQNHVRTLKLLLEAGSSLDPTILPTGNDELDTAMRTWLKKK
jgi:ankyrin repeat protein